MTYTALKDTVNAEQDYVDHGPLDQRLEALHVPLLVIFGAEDQIYDAQAAIARYRQVPGAQTHLIPGAGHSPNVEKPDLVAPLILAFAKPPPAPKPKKAKHPSASGRADKRPPKQVAAARRPLRNSAAWSALYSEKARFPGPSLRTRFPLFQ